MAKNLTEAQTFDTDVTVPETGDALSAASAELPWQQLANRSQYLKRAIDDPVQSVVLSGDAFTLAHQWVRYAILDTEGAAPTDTLDTISGGAQGQMLILRALDAARVPTIAEGGNIELVGGTSFALDDPLDHIVLVYSGAAWCELSRANNA